MHCLTRFCVLSTIVLIFAAAWTAPAIADDLQEVESVANTYLEAGRTGDQKLFREAFHPSCRLQFVKNAAYTEWAGAEYIGWQKPHTHQDRESRVLSVDVAGTAAVAKVEIRLSERVFTDYLCMLKIDGRWWIVNKVFHAEAR